jgi:hypothetical protein
MGSISSSVKCVLIIVLEIFKLTTKTTVYYAIIYPINRGEFAIFRKTKKQK